MPFEKAATFEIVDCCKLQVALYGLITEILNVIWIKIWGSAELKVREYILI